MRKLKALKNSLVVPGTSLSEEEFKAMIKKAENGLFYTAKQVSDRIDHWKTKYSK
jgi:predicted transcriptional regulator